MSLISISKLLATGVGYCLTNDDLMKAVDEKGLLSFSTAFEIFKTAAQAIGPEMMGGFNDEINYQKLRTILSEEHPDKINHDLSNLLKDAAVRSVGFVKKLYLEKITQEQEATFWRKIKPNPFKEEETALKNMQSDLKFWIQGEDIETLLLEKPEGCLNDITQYLFDVSGQDQNDERWIALRAFFKEKLPFCFDLAFKEALKENQKGRIAFQIWIWQDIQKDVKTTQANTEAILEEIKSLKLALENNAPEPENSLQFKVQIAQSFEELNRKFETFCVEIIGKLDELIDTTNRIEQNTTKILDKLETLKPESTHLPKELTLKIPKIHPSEVIGREKELEELHQLLFDNKHVVVVNGLGGIGKTTLAQAYMSLYYDDYLHIAWISQSNETDIENDFVNAEGLKENLKIATEGKDIKALHKEILSNLKALTDKPNLLLIDNTNSSLTRDFDSLPNQPNWHLLVTSRANIERFHPKELGFLKPEKALELFKTHCQWIKDEDGIKDLLKVIDYHTLTIEILAKTAQNQHTRIEVLKTAIEKDLKAPIFIKHKGGKIDKVLTYLSSIFDLSKLNPQEAWLMKQFACLPPEFINYELLLELIAPEGEQEENFAETLAELVSKGWLLANTETDSYKMHRIIAEVMLHKLNIELTEVENLINSITIKLNIDYTKDNPINKFQWIPYGKAIAENFEEETNSKIAVLQNNLGLRLQDLGDYEGAKKLLEKAMISTETNFGEKHLNTAMSYSNLAIVLQILGDYEGAKKLLEKATISDETNFGEKHPNTARSYSNLAMVLKDLGDYERAKKLLEKAMISTESNFGEKHPTTAVRYSNLALVLQDLGDYEGAKKLLEKAMISTESNFGEKHPNTAVSYSNLALVLCDLGDYEGAKKLLEKVMISTETNFGEKHPYTARSYSNLATVLKDLGDYEGAKKLLEKATISDETNFGEKHPTTARSYSNLALVLKDLGDYERAKKLLEKATISDENNFGEEHRNTALRQRNLASVLIYLKELDQAHILLTKAYATFVLCLGTEHPDTRNCLSWLIHVKSLLNKG
jgi:tetratricopeptide (TPR) repeat protein